MSGRIAAVLVVPHGTYRPEPLAQAVLTHHPTWELGAVWCGDPCFRPRVDGLAWLDDNINEAAEVALLAGEPLVVEWKRALGVTARLLADGFDRVVLLWVGAAAVISGLDELVEPHPQPMTLVPRAPNGIPDDGLAPTEAELSAEGLYSTTVAAFTTGAASAVGWLVEHLNGSTEVAHLLSRAAQLYGAHECRAESVCVGRWRWNSAAPALLDLESYDTRSPWTLDPACSRPLRIGVLGHAERQALLSLASSQLVGRRTPMDLPGGLRVDAAVRRVVAESQNPPPAPWSAAAQFRDWLAPRYWPVLRDGRLDLRFEFPDPEHRSATAFHQWCRRAFFDDEMPLLIAPPELHHRPAVVADRLRQDGLNLVGYFTRQSGLGDVARRLKEGVRQAGLAHCAIASQRTDSPTDNIVDVGNRIEFTNSLCLVNADQFALLSEDFPELFAATQRMIGYWFWELEYVPVPMRRAFALVDEVWAGSRFVTEAFAAVSPMPVRHVPVPIAEPQCPERSRASFELLTDVGERPLFITVFDYFSITERKNPIGVIDAFRRAFAPKEGPVLIIKTMNAHQRSASHLRVLAAADGRDDIRVWDETLPRADQMALVAAADCMVSLHRSEGLGLHLAEAMWLGTPVIATRYSGNLDFMSDDNSLLIDYDLVNVENGEGVYPPIAQWAAPDLEQAAASMRRIAGDAALRARLGAAGRRKMEQQPSLAETGRLVADLLLGRK